MILTGVGKFSGSGFVFGVLWIAVLTLRLRIFASLR